MKEIGSKWRKGHKFSQAERTRLLPARSLPASPGTLARLQRGDAKLPLLPAAIREDIAESVLDLGSCEMTKHGFVVETLMSMPDDRAIFECDALSFIRNHTHFLHKASSFIRTLAFSPQPNAGDSSTISSCFERHVRTC